LSRERVQTQQVQIGDVGQAALTVGATSVKPVEDAERINRSC
jgi:hypothetical protein